MRLNNGDLWPVPVVLDIDKLDINKIKLNQTVSLNDEKGNILANLLIQEIYKPDKKKEALNVYGTVDPSHPGVNYLFNDVGEYYVSGELDVIKNPIHNDFKELRKNPKEIKEIMKRNNIKKLVAFQTRNPMHRAHIELTKLALKDKDTALLIHPIVGMTKPGDIDYYTRVRIYKKILNKYEKDKVFLSLLPLAMRMAGPREALWHSIIRKNYGATHFIIGRDHAGPGKDKDGRNFYGDYDAQELVIKYQDEIGIKVIPFMMMVYLPSRNKYFPINKISNNEKYLDISGTELRRLLNEGEEIPEWFSYPEVVKELRKSYPLKHKQGLTLFFTGLSGSGKSTISEMLLNRLMEIDDRKISLLDGDIVRNNLSSELGFSKEHRDLNIKRIGYVASEITKHGGIAICAPIAPYDEARKNVRSMVLKYGNFILVHISTPLEECEKRDVKGLYKKARLGIIDNFTGISDKYEIPNDSELTIDTSRLSPQQSVELIIKYLKKYKYIN